MSEAPKIEPISFYVTGAPRRAEPDRPLTCGLPNVYLLGGVKIERDHGELATVTDLDGLYGAIGLRIMRKARGA